MLSLGNTFPYANIFSQTQEKLADSYGAYDQSCTWISKPAPQSQD